MSFILDVSLDDGNREHGISARLLYLWNVHSRLVTAPRPIGIVRLTVNPDEIDYGDGRALKKSIIGGAGIYAALGARLSAGTKHASRVSCIVDKGYDFPEEFQLLLEQWQTSIVFRIDLSRATTRAWNGYGPNQHRDFRYLTPKRRLEVESLNNDQALASTFHMVCSPSRCLHLVESLWARRKKLDSKMKPPIVIWEPIPDLCTPAEVGNLREASTFVDVISPNGDELAQFFALRDSPIDRLAMVEELLACCGNPPRQAVVVREGADGSRLYFQGRIIHFRSYHQDARSVVDPTGGGNTYLGGLAMALSSNVVPDVAVTWNILGKAACAESPDLNRLIMAAIHGTIAASYAIQQVGTPALDSALCDSWNGEDYSHRYLTYLVREGSYILEQVQGQA